MPFETLVDDHQTPAYLIERFAISYAPSASALATIHVRNQNDNPPILGLIAFGDPVYAEASLNASPATERGSELRQLPYSRAEVNEIAALFPAAQRKIFLGTDANEKVVKIEALQQYKYLHFAAHGNVDELHPARSGIVLYTSAIPTKTARYKCLKSCNSSSMPIW